MPVDRPSTYGNYQFTLSHINKLTTELSGLQIQVASGFKSQNFAGISDNARQYLQLEDQISRTKQFISNNSIISARIQTTNNVLSQVIDTGTSLKSLIAQRRTQVLDVGAFNTQLQAVWQTLTSQLNTQLDGRYLFSGGKTDTKAVDEDTFPTLAADGVPGQEYYQGDDTDLSVTIADGVNITYNVRANEEGFKKIFAALAAANEGDLADSDAKLEEAYNLLQEGIQDTIVLQAKTNSNIVQIAETKNNLTSLQTYWKGLSEEIANTDIVEASTQVAINQGILQASFQVFARLATLSLSDFLRN